MLLVDVVTAQPVVVVPVPHLVLHFSTAFLASLAGIPDSAAVPVNPRGENVADGTVVNPLEGFHVVPLVVPLETNADLQIFFLCGFDGRENFADSGCVDGNRFFHEDVLAGGNSRFEVDRSEAGRSRQNDQINIAGNHFFVGVKPSKFVIVVDLNLVAELRLQKRVLTLKVIGERVSHCDELDGTGRFIRVASCAECLARRACASAAAPDDADLDCLIASCKRVP